MAEPTHVVTDEIGQRFRVTVTAYVSHDGSPHAYVEYTDPDYAGWSDMYPTDALTVITTTTT